MSWYGADQHHGYFYLTKSVIAEAAQIQASAAALANDVSRCGPPGGPYRNAAIRCEHGFLRNGESFDCQECAPRRINDPRHRPRGAMFLRLADAIIRGIDPNQLFKLRSIAPTVSYARRYGFLEPGLPLRLTEAGKRKRDELMRDASVVAAAEIEVPND